MNSPQSDGTVHSRHCRPKYYSMMWASEFPGILCILNPLNPPDVQALFSGRDKELCKPSKAKGLLSYSHPSKGDRTLSKLGQVLSPCPSLVLVDVLSVIKTRQGNVSLFKLV